MLTSEEELWKQAMQLIIPAAPALLTFVMVWIIEIILLNKKIIGWGQEKKIEKAKQSGQVVDATITGSQKSYYYADGSGIEAVRYSYSIKGRRKRTKIVQFRVDGRTTFPETIKIYYLGKRIYTEDVYKRQHMDSSSFNHWDCTYFFSSSLTASPTNLPVLTE